MSNYRDLIIETYEHRGGGSHHSIRARPMSGQGLDTDMKVECSSKMRASVPVGSKIRIRAKIVNPENARSFLYTHFSWPYEVMSDQKAKEFIRKHNS